MKKQTLQHHLLFRVPMLLLVTALALPRLAFAQAGGDNPMGRDEATDYSVEIQVNAEGNNDDIVALGGSTPCQIQLAEPTEEDKIITLVSSTDAGLTRRLSFSHATIPTAPDGTLTLTLPKNGSPVAFSISGAVTGINANIEAHQGNANGELKASAGVMVYKVEISQQRVGQNPIADITFQLGWAAGRKIILQGAVMPTEAAALFTNPEWEISGNPITSYIHTATQGSTVPLSQPVREMSLYFYWPKSGNYTATFKGKISGQPVEGRVRFSVRNVSAQLTATTGQSYADDNYYNGRDRVTVPYLHYGISAPNDVNSAGIIFTSAVPSGQTSKFSFVQTGILLGYGVKSDGSRETLLAYGLDRTYPYPTLLSSANSLLTVDSPGVRLDPDDVARNHQNSFHMTLMYKYSDDSIEVPVSKIDWEWVAYVRRLATGAAWPAPTVSNTTSSAISDPEYPNWSSNLDNLIVDRIP